MASLSVIIPVFNAERFLHQAIDSVLTQTLPADQVIVVNDGSTDGSEDVIRSYGDQVRYLHQENMGSGLARNRGLEQARGEFISFLDADDIYLPTKLEAQHSLLAQDESVDIVVCKTRDFSWPETEPAKEFMSDASEFRYGQAQTWMVRREIFERVGGFNSRDQVGIAEGSDWIMRAKEVMTPMIELDKCLVLRRLHDANITRERDSHLRSIAMLLKQRVQHREKG
jgi:glycosyltransferase involved in cell wall biosynthesis